MDTRAWAITKETAPQPLDCGRRVWPHDGEGRKLPLGAQVDREGDAGLYMWSEEEPGTVMLPPGDGVDTWGPQTFSSFVLSHLRGGCHDNQFSTAPPQGAALFLQVTGGHPGSRLCAPQGSLTF